MKKKVLIIGGCGYIGSALFLYLTDKYQVDTLDLEWYGNFVNKDNIKGDYSRFSEKFYSKYDIIILLAGHSSVGMSCTNDQSAFRNNVLNFVDLLDKLNDNQVFIYASSASVYNGYIDKEATETDGIENNTTNFYDLSKKLADQYVKIKYGIKYYGLRFGTVNGGLSPNLRGDIMINAMNQCSISGQVIKISNPSIYRPILGLNDLVRAIDTIIESNTNKFGIYNLCSFNDTVLNIGTKVAEITNNKYEIINDISNSYNFRMSNKSFVSDFSFEFKENIDTIVESLRNNPRISYRNRPVFY